MTDAVIKISDEFSGAGNGDNCDLIIYGEDYAAVFDGASALGVSDLAPAEFVRMFASSFAAEYEKTRDLCSAINSAANIVSAASAHGGESGMSPSAAAVFVSVGGGIIRIAAFGDCTALVIGYDGTERIHKTDVDALDDEVLERVKNIRAQTGDDVADIVSSDEIRAMLIANRRKMNAIGGYRVLSAGMPPVTQDDITVRPLGGVKKIVLFSDGFDAAENRLAAGEPFCEVYKELRAEEDNDAKLNNRPRFKKSDDATALSFEIVRR